MLSTTRGPPARSSGSGSLVTPSPSRLSTSAGRAALLPAFRQGEPIESLRSPVPGCTKSGSASKLLDPGPPHWPCTSEKETVGGGASGKDGSWMIWCAELAQKIELTTVEPPECVS